MWLSEIWAKLNPWTLPMKHPGTPNTRIFWLYLISAWIIAALVFWFGKNVDSNRSLRNFLKFCFPKSIYNHPSARLDYLYFFFNQIVYGLLFLPFLLTVPWITGWVYVSLTNHFGYPAFQIVPGTGVSILVTLIAVLFSDFAQFIVHYLNHRITFLWNFHKVHHSAEVLTPITLYRAHPVELLINANLIAFSSGLVFGVFNYFAQTAIGPIMILKLNLVVFLFNMVGSNLRHSHIWISYPTFLSHLFISPAQHQIHHSLNRVHFNKNFGRIFAFWDYLFKSLYVPKEREYFKMGLPREEHKEFSGLWKVYFLPIKKNLALLFHRKPSNPPVQTTQAEQG